MLSSDGTRPTQAEHLTRLTVCQNSPAKTVRCGDELYALTKTPSAATLCLKRKTSTFSSRFDQVSKATTAAKASASFMQWPESHGNRSDCLGEKAKPTGSPSYSS